MTKTLPTERSQVSAKLTAFSALNIAKETLSLDLTFANMKTVERMVLSEWSLLDTCMCDPCLVLVVDMNSIAEPMPHQVARPARH